MGYIKATSDLEVYLAELEAARTAVLLGKSYSIGGRSLSRVDERWLSEEISRVESRLSRRACGGNSTKPIFVINR